MIDKNSRFENLDVWQRSIVLCKGIYKITNNFPSEEKFGLTAQIRRAAVSIPSNVAEGSSRDSDKDFSRFLNIAIGSAAELKTQIILAHELEFMTQAQKNELINQLHIISKMLYALKRSLKVQPTANDQRLKAAT